MYLKLIYSSIFTILMVSSCLQNHEPKTAPFLPYKKVIFNSSQVLINQDTTYIDNKICDGDVEFLFENGNLLSQVSFRNGLKDGMYREFFFTGEKKIEVTFENGIMTGEFKSYFPNGQVSERYNMVNGQKHGLHNYWFENGELMAEKTYSKGVLVKEKIYDNKGILIQNRVLKNNRMYGISIGEKCNING